MTMTYEIFGTEYDELDEAAEALNALFWDMCDDGGYSFKNDDCAAREAFNDWTDALCKDGHICAASYDEIALSDEMEALLTK